MFCAKKEGRQPFRRDTASRRRSRLVISLPPSLHIPNKRLSPRATRILVLALKQSLGTPVASVLCIGRYITSFSRCNSSVAFHAIPTGQIIVLEHRISSSKWCQSRSILQTYFRAQGGHIVSCHGILDWMRLRLHAGLAPIWGWASILRLLDGQHVTPSTGRM